MTKWQRAAGLFLVAFDPAHGFRPGTWRNDPIRGNQLDLTANLTDRAAQATTRSGHTIRALTLDCSTDIKCRNSA